MKILKDRFALATRHLRKDFTYLAGVSGGRDSVVLLHLLKAVGFQNVIICHLNHQLRKTASRDQSFTEKLASLSNSRIIIDKPKDVVDSGSLESKFRKLRHSFFARVVIETGAKGVFVGHHADDLAETFLWNLLRGSGSAGLSGIQPEKMIDTSEGPIRIYRPMLDIWRSEIDLYAQENQLVYMEDETNRSRKFTRNRLRHDIIPWLENKMQRNVRQNLHRAAAILNEENRCLENMVSIEDWDAPLSVAGLILQPIALQRRTILSWLQHHQISEAGFEEVELVRSLLDLETGPARINLSKNRQARRRAGKINLATQ